VHGVLGACDFGLFNLLSKPFGHIHSVGCACKRSHSQLAMYLGDHDWLEYVRIHQTSLLGTVESHCDLNIRAVIVAP
jgi:hypothetical protein